MLTTTCSFCAREIVPAETYFCYWCGRVVCPECLSRVALPLASEAMVCPACAGKPMKDEAADESMMEIMVDAAVAGHDLTAWQLTEDGSGWQTRCRCCQETAWVGVSGVQYSLLSEICRGG